MSASLKINNFGDRNIKERSQINADAAAAQAGLTLLSTSGMVVNDSVVVGAMGTERAELKKIQSITNATALVLTTNLSFAHVRFEAFTVLLGDQIKIYRAANVDGSQPADAAFSFLDTIDIDFDQQITNYTDNAGDSTYWYKAIYFNSISGASSVLADATAARGGGVGNYCTIEDIRGEAGFANNPFITDALIDQKRQEAQARVNGALVGIYTIPFTSPIHPLIQQVTRLLAAGYLLNHDFGVMSSLSTENGKSKVDAGEAILEKLNTKKLVITNALGADTSTEGAAGGFTGWPNEDTEDAEAEDGGGERLFRISDRY